MRKRKKKKRRVVGIPTRRKDVITHQGHTLDFDEISSTLNKQEDMLHGKEFGSLVSPRPLTQLRKDAVEGKFSMPASVTKMSVEQAKARIALYFEALISKSDGRPHIMEFEPGRFEAFIPDLEEDKLIYYRFLGRGMQTPSRAIMEELSREGTKKWNRSRGGHREEIVLTMMALYYSLSWIAPIPTRNGSFDVNHRSFLVATLNQIVQDEDALELQLTMMKSKEMREIWAYGLAHVLSHADTPIWISMEQDLSELLLLTDLRGIKCSDIRLPHSVLLLEIPPGLITIEDEGHKMDARIIMAYKAETQGIDSLIVSAQFAYLPDPHPHYVRIGFVAPFQHEDDELTALPLDHFKEKEDGRSFTIASERVSQAQLYNAIFAFVVNAAIYMSSPKADVRKRRPRPPQMRKSIGKSKRNKIPKPEWEEWIVGSSIKHPTPPRGIEDVPRDSAGHRILKAAFYVKGYWIHQFHGKNRALRKLQWRLPQVRKRRVAERVVGRTYVES